MTFGPRRFLPPPESGADLKDDVIKNCSTHPHLYCTAEARSDHYYSVMLILWIKIDPPSLLLVSCSSGYRL